MDTVYFYCARANMDGVQTLSSGTFTLIGDATEDIYKDALEWVCENTVLTNQKLYSRH